MTTLLLSQLNSLTPHITFKSSGNIWVYVDRLSINALRIAM